MSIETLKGFNKKGIAISAMLRWRSLGEDSKKKKPFIRFARRVDHLRAISHESG
jgi:hypothetical protein